MLRFKKALAYIISYLLPPFIMRSKDNFSLWEAKRYHVTPVHFYEPIPELRSLDSRLWNHRPEIPGVNLNPTSQIEMLNSFASHFGIEYDQFPKGKTNNPLEYYLQNPHFGSVDGEILYGMVRYFKPKRIIEVGSGFSTLLIVKAISMIQKEDGTYKCKFISIEPYPSDFIKNGVPGLSKLLMKKVKEVPLSDFESLSENDILFIDSTHVSKIGSDVDFEYLSVLPCLRKGVIVHAHDIFLPAEYPEDWVKEHHLFWNEQYLLQAFLCFNESFSVLWASHFMHLYHQKKLENRLKSYNRNITRPASFWFKKIK